MPSWPHLDKAPITEALLDIRADLPPEADLNTLARFQETIHARYPNRKDRIDWQGHLELSETSGPAMRQVSGGHNGYFFLSADARQVVQVRKDGFTFSRLKPYETWERLRDEARELWNLYRSILNPIRITRIAVRYVNRIEIPLPVGNFRTWILTAPDIAPTLPQTLSGFLMRLTMPFALENAIAIVTQTLEPGQHSNSIPMIFDIDVYREQITDLASSDLWDDFEILRSVKNRVFFESITRKTEELFR
ncbi:TIGR04255 family protein [Haliangium sp. UPWRP_2]|uniref:TIGR04255 family protein n=1 Tax=Haliangium sp. UPWRP_2 TaxID=1931276 RepID=UPI000B545276|nr:TIGR04255 family protein [Haliangium sp. UPWRP_2]PSM31678.1 TIGR04255 family protein [Haliangium sp. UPWRP_2]